MNFNIFATYFLKFCQDDRQTMATTMLCDEQTHLGVKEISEKNKCSNHPVMFMSKLLLISD